MRRTNMLYLKRRCHKAMRRLAKAECNEWPELYRVRKGLWKTLSELNWKGT